MPKGEFPILLKHAASLPARHHILGYSFILDLLTITPGGTKYTPLPTLSIWSLTSPANN